MKKQIIFGLLAMAAATLISVDAKAATSTSDMKSKMKDYAKTDLDEFTAVDIDGDKKSEAIGTYIDKKQKCHVLYCDQDGKVSEIKAIGLDKDTSWTTIDILSQGKENHVLVNTSNETNLGENSIIIGSKNHSPEIIFSAAGALHRDDDDNLMFSKKDYHGVYDKEGKFFLGRSGRITYLEYKDGEYKEIVAKRIINDLSSYDNGEEIRNKILKSLGVDYALITVLERSNGIVHVCVEDSQSSKDEIIYSYYTGKKKGRKLDIKIGKEAEPGIVEPALFVDGAEKAIQNGYVMAAASNDGKAAIMYKAISPVDNQAWAIPIELLYNGKLTKLPYEWFIKYAMDDIDVECGDFDNDKADEIVIVKSDEGGPGHLTSDVTVIENPGTKNMSLNIFNVDVDDHDDMKKGTSKKNGMQITVSNPLDTIDDLIVEKENKAKNSVSIIQKSSNKELGYIKFNDKNAEPTPIYWAGMVNPKIEKNLITIHYVPVVAVGVLADHYVDLKISYKYKKDGALEPFSVSAEQLSL